METGHTRHASATRSTATLLTPLLRRHLAPPPSGAGLAGWPQQGARDRHMPPGRPGPRSRVCLRSRVLPAGRDNAHGATPIRAATFYRDTPTDSRVTTPAPRRHHADRRRGRGETETTRQGQGPPQRQSQAVHGHLPSQAERKKGRGGTTGGTYRAHGGKDDNKGTWTTVVGSADGTREKETRCGGWGFLGTTKWRRTDIGRRIGVRGTEGTRWTVTMKGEDSPRETASAKPRTSGAHLNWTGTPYPHT